MFLLFLHLKDSLSELICFFLMQDLRLDLLVVSIDFRQHIVGVEADARGLTGVIPGLLLN